MELTGLKCSCREEGNLQPEQMCQSSPDKQTSSQKRGRESGSVREREPKREIEGERTKDGKLLILPKEE